MNYTVEPWNVTGMSDRGPYIRVRGNQLGSKFKVANIPFSATETSFYDVLEAKEYAKLISFAPTMMRLIQAIAEGHTGVDIIAQSKMIWEDMEHFKKVNK